MAPNNKRKFRRSSSSIDGHDDRERSRCTQKKGLDDHSAAAGLNIMMSTTQTIMRYQIATRRRSARQKRGEISSLLAARNYPLVVLIYTMHILVALGIAVEIRVRPVAQKIISVATAPRGRGPFVNTLVVLMGMMLYWPLERINRLISPMDRTVLELHLMGWGKNRRRHAPPNQCNCRRMSNQAVYRLLHLLLDANDP